MSDKDDEAIEDMDPKALGLLWSLLELCGEPDEHGVFHLPNGVYSTVTHHEPSCPAASGGACRCEGHTEMVKGSDA